MNPRAPEDNLISSQARYGHFATSPCEYAFHINAAEKIVKPEKEQRMYFCMKKVHKL